MSNRLFIRFALLSCRPPVASILPSGLAMSVLAPAISVPTSAPSPLAVLPPAISVPTSAPSPLVAKPAPTASLRVSGLDARPSKTVVRPSAPKPRPPPMPLLPETPLRANHCQRCCHFHPPIPLPLPPDHRIGKVTRRPLKPSVHQHNHPPKVRSPERKLCHAPAFTPADYLVMAVYPLEPPAFIATTYAVPTASPTVLLKDATAIPGTSKLAPDGSRRTGA